MSTADLKVQVKGRDQQRHHLQAAFMRTTTTLCFVDLRTSPIRNQREMLAINNKITKLSQLRCACAQRNITFSLPLSGHTASSAPGPNIVTPTARDGPLVISSHRDSLIGHSEMPAAGRLRLTGSGAAVRGRAQARRARPAANLNADPASDWPQAACHLSLASWEVLYIVFKV